MDRRPERLIEAAAGRYRDAGNAVRHFARWKYRLDPVYLALLRRGRLPDRGRLLDLGCGDGLLLALILAARDAYRAGAWPEGWPAPPMHLELAGIEHEPGPAQSARAALGDQAAIEQADVRKTGFPGCSAVVLLDVLFYMREGEQADVLDRAARALDPGGLLLLREADADAGLAFQLTRAGERAREIGRGRWRNRLHYRGANAWTGLLEALGFTVDAEPMSAGTPFANVLFVCTKR